MKKAILPALIIVSMITNAVLILVAFNMLDEIDGYKVEIERQNQMNIACMGAKWELLKNIESKEKWLSEAIRVMGKTRRMILRCGGTRYLNYQGGETQ